MVNKPSEMHLGSSLSIILQLRTLLNVPVFQQPSLVITLHTHSEREIRLPMKQGDNIVRISDTNKNRN